MFIVSLLTFFLGLFISGPTLANQNPYIGLGLQQSYMNFCKGYGDNLLFRDLQKINPYIGFKLNDSFAIESGFEFSIPRYRIVFIQSHEIMNDLVIPPIISPVSFRSKMTVRGLYASMVYFRSLSENVSIFYSLGPSFLRGTVERDTMSVANYIHFAKRSMVGKKTALRTSLGVQYKLKENLFLRTSFGFLNTSKMNIRANDNIISIKAPEVRPKNTVFFEVGLLWQ